MQTSVHGLNFARQSRVKPSISSPLSIGVNAQVRRKINCNTGCHWETANEIAEKSDLTPENLPGLSPPLRLAQEMGEGLG